MGAGRKLLERICSGRLRPGQERSLLRSSLENQEIFDDWMEAELIRDALQSPDQRERLARALAAQQPARRTIWRPVAVGGALAAVAIVVALSTGPWGRSSPEPGGHQLIPASPGVTPTAPADLADLFRLPAQRGQPVQVALNRGGARPLYRPGEMWRLEVRPAEEAEVWVFERNPDGSIRLLFPTGSRAGSRVSAGLAGIEQTVGQPVGRRLVRVLVLPPGSTLPAGETAEGRITVVDLEYEVTAP